MWAAAIHAQCPDVNGLRWVSRQHDRELTPILFGDRLKQADLKLVGGPTDLLTDAARYAKLLHLAQALGVNLV